MIVVGVILALSVVVVMIAPRVAARRVLGSRERLADDKLVDLFSASVHLPSDTILMVLKSMGAGYGINYSELRPSDDLVLQLSKIDSWRFDAGLEKTQELFRERFGLSVPADSKSLSILDLMKLIDPSETSQAAEIVPPPSKPTR